MFYIDEILFEFKGQLSINDIYNMTYKELGYLREHRALVNKNPSAEEQLAGLFGG